MVGREVEGREVEGRENHRGEARCFPSHEELVDREERNVQIPPNAANAHSKYALTVTGASTRERSAVPASGYTG